MIYDKDPSAGWTDYVRWLDRPLSVARTQVPLSQAPKRLGSSVGDGLLLMESQLGLIAPSLSLLPSAGPIE